MYSEYFYILKPMLIKSMFVYTAAMMLIILFLVGCGGMSEQKRADICLDVRRWGFCG
jgi:hypothetical protein